MNLSEKLRSQVAAEPAPAAAPEIVEPPTNHVDAQIPPSTSAASYETTAHAPAVIQTAPEPAPVYETPAPAPVYEAPAPAPTVFESAPAHQTPEPAPVYETPLAPVFETPAAYEAPPPAEAPPAPVYQTPPQVTSLFEPTRPDALLTAPTGMFDNDASPFDQQQVGVQQWSRDDVSSAVPVANTVEQAPDDDLAEQDYESDFADRLANDAFFAPSESAAAPWNDASFSWDHIIRDDEAATATASANLPTGPTVLPVWEGPISAERIEAPIVPLHSGPETEFLPAAAPFEAAAIAMDQIPPPPPPIEPRPAATMQHQIATPVPLAVIPPPPPPPPPPPLAVPNLPPLEPAAFPAHIDPIDPQDEALELLAYLDTNPSAAVPVPPSVAPQSSNGSSLFERTSEPENLFASPTPAPAAEIFAPAQSLADPLSSLSVGTIQPPAAITVQPAQEHGRSSLIKRLLNKDTKKKSKQAGDAGVEHPCPSCGTAANVDISDPWRGLLHMNCPSCFKMWQEVDPTVAHA